MQRIHIEKLLEAETYSQLSDGLAVSHACSYFANPQMIVFTVTLAATPP